ncbi:oxidoreductase [Ensifer soli]|uniref:oxidoreductase n=1 Tax=Ciceribacter sp. sgz301302 TaxID=3342379 RepID=UPI0035BA196E
MTLPNDAVWFVTGASTGFGRIFVDQALALGHRVVATARNPAQLRDLWTGHGDRVLSLPLDVTDGAAITRAVQEAESRFGRIDILVNNAGYGYFGAIEEGIDADIRAVFDTNVFGLAAVTRAVLPGFRRRGFGRIVNLSSIAGLSANPGAGYYAATKHAVEALSEALAQEGAAFGIRVLIVEPGPYRTDFAGRSIQVAPPVDAYVGGPSGRNIRAIRASNGVQDGDPEKAVRLVLEALAADAPPLRLVLGPVAIDRARAKLAGVLADIDAYEERSRRTTLDAAPARLGVAS